MGNILFKMMTLEDLNTVLAIEKAAQKFPWNQQKFQDCLKSNYYCVLILQAHQIVGYAILSSVLDEAELLTICIHPDFQHHGYGKMLVEHLISYIAKNKIKKIFLEVATSNVTAISFYEKQGFKKVSIRKQYYHREDGVSEDALIYCYERLDWA